MNCVYVVTTTINTRAAGIPSDAPDLLVQPPDIDNNLAYKDLTSARAQALKLINQERDGVYANECEDLDDITPLRRVTWTRLDANTWKFEDEMTDIIFHVSRLKIKKPGP